MSLEIKQCFLTNNITYKKQLPIKPQGIVVHSTGVNQPNLWRWVQPSNDDPNKEAIWDDIGRNYGMGWNTDTIDTIVHAMIGKNLKGDLEVYQTLQFDKRCGGCYHGVNGSYNDTHIQFEMQEDNLKDANYFNAMMSKAIELCAHLCKIYNIPVSEICSHKEAAERGYASFHGDPHNWFELYGWTMDKFRSEVQKMLNPVSTIVVYSRGDIVSIKPGITTNYSGKQLAPWVYSGANKLYVYDSNETFTKITIDSTLSAVTATMNTVDLLPVKTAAGYENGVVNNTSDNASSTTIESNSAQETPVIEETTIASTKIDQVIQSLDLITTELTTIKALLKS